MTSATTEIAVSIAFADRHGRRCDATQYVLACASVLSEAADGAFATQGVGYWSPPAGNLQEEPATRLVALGEPDRLHLCLPGLLVVLAAYARGTDQAEVLVVVNGNKELLTREQLDAEYPDSPELS